MKILPKSLQIEFEKLNFVYDHLATGLVMNILVGAALLAVMYPVEGSSQADIWYGCLFTVVVLRFAILYLYRRSKSKITLFRRWWLAFVIGAFAMGTVWGTGGLVLFPENDVGRQIFLCFIIGGMAMGAVPYLSPLLPAYYFFLFPASLPVSLYLLTYSDSLHVILGMSNILFSITMVVAARLNQKNFLNNYNLRYANEGLVNRLNEINNELQHKIYLKSQVEQDLRENEHRYKALSNAAHDGVIVHIGNIIIEANEAAARMSGYSVRDLVGKAVLDLISDDSKEDIIQRLTSPGYEAFETNCIRKDGSVFRAEINPDDVTYKGQPARIVSVRDISKQKQIEHDLLYAKNAAEEADKLKGEFLASISHELRTPLNAITGIFQILDDANLTARQREYLDIGGNSAKQLLSLIDELLDLSRIETGNIEFHYQDTNLNALLYEVMQIMSFKAKESGNELNLSISENLPEAVYIEPDRLKQILINLIGNGVKFTEQGLISIKVSLQTTENNQQELLFEISDNGIGIPKDKQSLIFNRFTQLDSSISRNYGGAGLGLAICKELVTNMGGEIGVVSDSNEGASFWFSLPFKKATSIQGKAEYKEFVDQRAGSLKGALILLVEDEETNQIIARSMLEKLGCVVDVLSDGEQAVANNKTYDLILMDLQMPKLDGLAAARMLREQGCKTPIIALTANAMPDDRKRCLEAGMDDYISKPIDIEKLAHTLVRWLPEKRQSASH